MPVRDLLSAASGASGPATYVEDVFSTWLYTGNGSTQTITNGIDLSGKGGMVWTKNRASATYPANVVFDTVRGAGKGLITNSTAAQDGSFTQSFSSTGFALGGDNYTNQNGIIWTSWTFRKQPKFFDVVTYTGDGAGSRFISHSLGSQPGFVIIKCTSTTSDWNCRQVALGTSGIKLNTTAAAVNIFDTYNTDFTSTQFNVYKTSSTYADWSTNESGETYVAYLFAHNAGGFGLSGTDNVISCGSFTCNGSGFASVTLGYEPQYLLVKRTDGANNWWIADNMRGLTAPTSNYQMLQANTSNAETSATNLNINATGFTSNNAGLAGMSFIYMAIRRPMKVPTDATTVFKPVASNASEGTKLTTNFPIDSQWLSYRAGLTGNAYVSDRLRGNSSTTTSSGIVLNTSATGAENSVDSTRYWDNTGFQVPSYWANYDMVYWNFARRPGFFDEVCYTGTGSSGNVINHNLTVAPQLIILKRRDASAGWPVWTTGFNGSEYVVLQSTSAKISDAPVVNFSNIGATSFQIDSTWSSTNASGGTYVTYLFATCPGVSKVGSYTGTGASQTINCGFTGGARFVMIKRTDSTSNWFVWDTARGMVAGTDPSLSLNSTAAEVNANSVYTATTGFSLLASPSADVNTSGGSYIFLAIA